MVVKFEIMKKIVKVICLGVSAIMCSCTDPALKADYGNTYIYMPQATHNLGIDNNLYLDLSLSELQSGSVKNTSTTIGIYRSGIAKFEEVSVDLIVDADSLNTTIARASEPNSKLELYKDGVLLDQKYYNDLPENLTIKEGNREETTQLILNNELLYGDYKVGQKLFLPLRIINPTRYTLNKDLSFTMVVVTLNN